MAWSAGPGTAMAVSPMSPMSPERDDEKNVFQVKKEEIPIVIPSKAEILMSIEKLDAEIGKMEVKISTEKNQVDSARRKLNEKNKEMTKQRPVLTAADYERNREDLYQDNRGKALENEAYLASLVGSMQIDPSKPLYTTPQSTASWKENQTIHKKFAPILYQKISQTLRRRHQLQQNMIDHYIKCQKQWIQQVREINGAARRMARSRYEEETEEEVRSREEEAVKREEEIKREEEVRREEEGRREEDIASARSSRALRVRSSSGILANAVRSEEEFEQVMRELRQEDNRDPRMRFIRTLAKVTPMILSQEQRERNRFFSTNLLVIDPVGEAQKYRLEHPWEDNEIQIFKERWLQYPKDYRKIATFLPRRSVGDVVRFYFLNKHRLGLRRSLRMYQIKKREQRQQKLVVQPQISTKGRGQNRQSIDPVDLPDPADYKPIPRTTSSMSIVSSTQPGVRWTENEREVFPSMLLKHGKDWQSISDEMVSKSPAQVKHFFRNYRRKYGFDDILDQRLQSPSSHSSMVKSTSSASLSRPRARPTTWTNEEKETFLSLFRQHGRNWQLIARTIGGKTPTQVRTFYQNSRSRYGFDSSEIPRDESTQSLASLNGSSDDQRFNGNGEDVDMNLSIT